MHSENKRFGVRLMSRALVKARVAASALVLLLVSTLGVTAVVTASESGLDTVRADTVAEYPSPVIVECVRQRLSEVHLLEQLNKTLALVSHPCSGGVYLVDSSKATEGQETAEAMFSVVQGWWLQSLKRVTLIDDNTVVVAGRFLTGVGPMGARPFSALITVTKHGKVWRAGEPKLGKKANWNTGPRGHVDEVGTQAELDGIRFCRGQRAVSLSVDFSHERLLLGQIHLRSSKIKIIDPLVSVDNDSYTLHYQTQTPAIVSKDFKYVVLWFVLPKDDKTVGLYRGVPAMHATVFGDARSGVIDRCRYERVFQNQSDQ